MRQKETREPSTPILRYGLRYQLTAVISEIRALTTLASKIGLTKVRRLRQGK